jgi:folate-binding protein YgfZ
VTAIHVPTTNYGALRGDAVLVDRSARLRMTFSGDKAKEALGGLVTNDVALLKPGVAQRSVALTPKGRVIAMVRVLDRSTDLLVDCEPSAGEGFASMIKKFVNPRLAKHEVITDRTDSVGVYGPRSSEVVSAAIGADRATLDALSPLGWLTAVNGVIALRSDELGGGFDLIGERDAIAAARAALSSSGVAELDATALEIAQLESGIPRFGIEMDAETIPQEANLDLLGAMSFNKGCFTGQEVVARIHFRGHVNRHLRRLRAVSPLAKGDVVLDSTGKEVGDVRSAAVSPAIGPIAIAMIRREVEPGSRVQVRNADALVDADVEALA